MSEPKPTYLSSPIDDVIENISLAANALEVARKSVMEVAASEDNLPTKWKLYAMRIEVYDLIVSARALANEFSDLLKPAEHYDKADAPHHLKTNGVY